MRNTFAFLSLPTSLLLLILTASPHTAALGSQWPYNLSPDIKYYPQDEPLVRRNIEIQRRLVDQKPVAVRKMSEDEGEMFFLDYWQFDRTKHAQLEEGSNLEIGNRSSILGSRHMGKRDNKDARTNSSIPLDYSSPFLLHTEQPMSPNPLFRRLIRTLPAKLDQRDFVCPSGTASCASIGQPDICCPTGDTCQLVTDSSLGNVGCCASGQQCSGAVQNCQTGYTPCPGSSGGGCCVPGYQCAGVGCTLISTTIVVINPTVTATPSTSTSTIIPTTSSQISSLVSSSTAASSSLTTTAAPSSATPIPPLTCSSGFRSCPATLGGGCCPTDRLCGSMACPASPTTTNTPGAPVRPTSVSVASATITATSPITVTGSTCPTGFYQCSAYYNGGSCCRVGRDCQLTSCPLAASTTVLASDGVTVVVKSALTSGTIAAGAGSQQGTCATGWLSCPGGGCCPNGYGCAGTSCTATASGASVTQGSQSVAALVGREVAWQYGGMAVVAWMGIFIF